MTHTVHSVDDSPTAARELREAGSVRAARGGVAPVDLTPSENTRVELMAIDPYRPERVLIATNQRDPRVFDVYALDPRSGAVRRDSKLPEPVSDAGVLALGNAIVVAGGRTQTGTQTAVGELAPTP